MGAANLVGIEIGSYRIKFTYLSRGEVKQYFSEDMPDNLVENGMIRIWEPTADFIRECLKKHGISCRNVVFVMPLNGYYIKIVELPLMTIAQLRINLPFEFHDYISDSSDNYYYDYAVLSKDEKSMRLLAVASAKKLIEQYKELAKRAKLKIVAIVPSVLGLQRVIQRYELKNQKETHDYAILDAGDDALRIHFFKNGIYEITRSLEPGVRHFAEQIVEHENVDIHIARIMLEENQKDIQHQDFLMQEYDNPAVQIMRVLNFYSYSNTQNTIDTLYITGGGAEILPFIQDIAETISLPIRRISVLMNYIDEAAARNVAYGPVSYGVLLNPEDKVKPLSEKELARISERKEEDFLTHKEAPVEATPAEASPTTRPQEEIVTTAQTAETAGDETPAPVYDSDQAVTEADDETKSSDLVTESQDVDPFTAFRMQSMGDDSTEEGDGHGSN